MIFEFLVEFWGKFWRDSKNWSTKLRILDLKIKMSSPFQTTKLWNEFQTWFSNSMISNLVWYIMFQGFKKATPYGGWLYPHSTVLNFRDFIGLKRSLTPAKISTVKILCPAPEYCMINAYCIYCIHIYLILNTAILEFLLFQLWYNRSLIFMSLKLCANMKIKNCSAVERLHFLWF